MDDKIKITYPSSEKVYMTGKLHPEIKVGMRKVLPVSYTHLMF